MQSWVGGRYAQSGSGAVLGRTVNSAYDMVSGVYECASQELVSQAVAKAQTAQVEWRAKSPMERGRVLLETARLLRQKTREISLVESLNTSRAISEVLVTDVASAAECFEYFGGSASAQHVGEMHDFANGNFAYTRREPLGVTVGIGAFNYPLQSAAWKAAPALAFGNAMVFKPAEDTPLSALKLAETLKEAGLPDGLFSVLLGPGHTVGSALVSDKRVAKISFTGSVQTGTQLASQAALEVKKVTLELGGKSPMIVFEDADLDQAVTGALLGNFYSNGQICSNGTRVFVHAKVHDEFVRRFVERTRLLRIGDPLHVDTDVGPLIHQRHLDKVLGFVQRAEQEGATLVLGGRRITDAKLFHDGNAKLLPGAFMTPAIFTDVQDGFEIATREVFGPVACVLRFSSEAEVIARANDTEFGLAAGVFTKDLVRAHRTIAQLQAGCCWINHFNLSPVELPWGGFKQSGLGRENSTEALHYWTQLKSVYVDMHGIADPYPKARV